MHVFLLSAFAAMIAVRGKGKIVTFQSQPSQITSTLSNSVNHAVYGPYLWGIYDILVMPPSYPYGGTENPCLTFITPTLLVSFHYKSNAVLLFLRVFVHFRLEIEVWQQLMPMKFVMVGQAIL